METTDFNLVEPRLTRKVRAHWLTQKPDSNSFLVAGTSLLSLLIASLLYWRDDFHLAGLMTAIPQNVFEKHEYWRLWTSLLAHEDMAHLLSNSLLFSVFSYFLFGYFGGFVFPVATFLFGGIVNYIVLITMPANSELLGVSGVVYWMGSVWLTLYFLIETREKISRRLIKTIGIAAVLFIPETYHRNVSYLSHFVGFALGMVFALLYFRQNRLRFQRAEFIEWVNNDGDVIPPEPRY